MAHIDDRADNWQSEPGFDYHAEKTAKENKHTDSSKVCFIKVRILKKNIIKLSPEMQAFNVWMSELWLSKHFLLY